MRAEKYYDVGCDFCGRHLSTDFATGMFSTKEQALKAAKAKGFRTLKGLNICPICQKDRKSHGDF